MAFWKKGWTGAPTSYFPKRIRGLGEIKEVATGPCSVCSKTLTIAAYGRGSTRLCLMHAVSYESAGEGRSDEALVGAS